MYVGIQLTLMGERLRALTTGHMIEKASDLFCGLSDRIVVFDLCFLHYTYSALFVTAFWSHASSFLAT